MLEPTPDSKTFLDVLFPSSLDNEYIEARLFPTSKESKLPPIQRFYSSKEEVLTALPELLDKQSQGYGVYVGVCPRRVQEGSKGAVSCALVLWADLDAKSFAGDKQKALEAIQQFMLKPTMIVDSGHGYHAYWLLKEAQTDMARVESYLKGITNAVNADSAVCEVSRVMRLPGSVNNKEVSNPLTVSIVEHNKDYFYALEDFNFVMGTKVEGQEVVQEVKNENWIPKALAELKDGNRNNTFAKLIGRFINSDYSIEDAFALLEAHAEISGFSKAELKKEIGDMYKRYPKESAPDEKVEKYSAHFDGLVDIVQDKAGNPAFLIKDNGQLNVVPEWEVNGEHLIPPPQEAMRWLLPRAEEVLEYYKEDNDKQLYLDLLEYHRNISELPSLEYYDLLVAWDMHTYLLEKFRYSPYLYFFAVTERGKTRTGHGLIYVAYRGYRTETLSEAQLIRLAGHAKVTLFIDATDLWKNAEKKGIEDVLLGRYEMGSQISRVLYPDRGPFQDTVYFDIFGATIIATNVKVSEVLETRAIEINMPETDKKYEDDVEPENSLPLRERLVAFRARHLDTQLPQVNKPTKGRLGDILKPLFQIIYLVNPDREGDFIRLIEIVEGVRKLERSECYEAELLKAVIGLEHKVEKGLLLTEEITNYINIKRSERFHLTSKRIGKDLVALGFVRKSASNGNAAIDYDKAKIERLKDRYGLKRITGIAEITKGVVASDISVVPEVIKEGS